MKIAMVSEHASPLATLGGVDAGGQNVHVAELARALGRRGHTVEIYTRRDAGDLRERVPLAQGATVVHVPVGPARAVPKDDLFAMMPDFGRWMEKDWMRHGLPDVVHAHFWMSGLAALTAAATCDVPVAQTFHALGTVKRRYQGLADTSPPERLECEQMIGQRVDKVIATCSDEVRELVAMGTPASRLTVVPCGVDTARFAPGSTRRPRSHPQMLAVGRLVERKGYDTAIQALALLPSVELVIAGGPARERLLQDDEACRLMALAEALGVAERVRLVGQIRHDHMPDLYRTADIVVATPWYEPFGITPLEAAACARPVVGSAVGGLLDTVEDGVTGRLVPPRDADAVAGAVAEILADAALARRWGVAARGRACDRYDWARVACATEDALQEAVDRKASLPAGVVTTAGPATSVEGRDGSAALSLPLVPNSATPVVGNQGSSLAESLSSSTDVWLRQHGTELDEGLRSLAAQSELIESWGCHLAKVLPAGGRLLAVGNGGSAAEAQHLTAELVGRFLGERRPFSAVSLCAETSSLTAVLNDYGIEEMFARQVEAHGRPGDILVALSTSGRSPNVLAAAKRAHDVGLTVWALTGPEPNPLSGTADAALTVSASSTAAVQEIHLMAVHALCAALDRHLQGLVTLAAQPAQSSVSA